MVIELSNQTLNRPLDIEVVGVDNLNFDAKVYWSSKSTVAELDGIGIVTRES